MEVHHHGHHGGKKNWKSYFWEFLMLFLAVTLGFFVENQREHYIEHVRAKEFSKTLVKDLQNDTVFLHDQRKNSELYIAFADSLLAISQTKLEGTSASRFSFYTRFMYWTGAITWNNSTFEQIKNSGSLRYFKNYQLLEKMMNYDAAAKRIDMEANNNTIRGNLMLKQINSVIDPVYHQELSKYFLVSADTMSRHTMERLCSRKVESLENKRADIKELLNMVVVQQRNFQRNVDVSLKQAEELAIELINELKKEYHLK
jgi:hypothetical protein